MTKKQIYRKNFLDSLAKAFTLDASTLETLNPRAAGFVGFEQLTNAVESTNALDENGRPEKVVSVSLRAVKFPTRRVVLTFWPHGEIKKNVAESNAKYVRNILTAFVGSYGDVATFGDVADVVSELGAALDRPGLQSSDDVLVSACNLIISGFARRQPVAVETVEPSTVATELEESNDETGTTETPVEEPTATPPRPTRKRLGEKKEG